MPQPPLRVDALEIVGDSGVGSRLIESDQTTGELVFTDAVVSGRKLADIVGLQDISGVIVCGKGGNGVSKDADGNPITTIQQALDAVPTSSSLTDPWLVLVMTGLYIENVFLDRDGVRVFGLGNVILRNATASDTCTILEGPFSVPHRAIFQNIRFENTAAGAACVRITSALYATGTITVSDVTFVGDTVSIDGNVLTAIANGSTPVAGEFEIGTTFDETAENLADAINDPLNTPINTLVKATVSGAVVSLQALEPGLTGNAITLATSVPLTFVLSAATLTGGVDSAAGSTVGDGRCDFFDCDFDATDPAGFHMIAESINNIYITHGNWSNSSTGAILRVHECANLEIVDTCHINSLDLRYDSVGGGPLPSIATSSYTLRGVSVDSSLTFAGDGGVGSLTLSDTSTSILTLTSAGAEPLVVDTSDLGAATITSGGVTRVGHSHCGSLTLSGAGTNRITHVTCDTDLVVSTSGGMTCDTSDIGGDCSNTGGGSYEYHSTSCDGTMSCDSGSLELQNCSSDTLTLTGTAVCLSRNSRFVAITPSGPGPTLDIDEIQLEAVFVASPSEVVTFPVEQPDAAYHVYLDSPLVPAAIGDVPAVPIRTAASFTVSFGAPQTLTVGATARRFP